MEHGTGTEMKAHMEQMAAMRRSKLWAHYLVIALGAWLATSPFQFGLFDAEGVQTARDLSGERDLWLADTRAALNGWSDLACGALLMLTGALSLTPRFKMAQWGTTAIGLWLLFAPLHASLPRRRPHPFDRLLDYVFHLAGPLLVHAAPRTADYFLRAGGDHYNIRSRAPCHEIDASGVELAVFRAHASRSRPWNRADSTAAVGVDSACRRLALPKAASIKKAVRASARPASFSKGLVESPRPAEFSYH